jgi:transposase-like protein
MCALVHHLPIELSRSPGDDGRARHCRVATTILRWVSRYVPELREAMESLRTAREYWRVDETYIEVRGKWNYLYRAVDKHGKTMDFLLRPDRGIAAAQAFFRKALATSLPRWPRKVTLDGHVPSHPGPSASTAGGSEMEEC